jgi:hypothetical protein
MSKHKKKQSKDFFDARVTLIHKRDTENALAMFMIAKNLDWK